jgi:hypothetical protein
VRYDRKLSDARWKMYPTVCARSRRNVPQPASLTRVPATSTKPPVGWSMPARMRNSDDFPLPEGPATTVSAPSPNRAETPRSARTSDVRVQ